MKCKDVDYRKEIIKSIAESYNNNDLDKANLILAEFALLFATACNDVWAEGMVEASKSSKREVYEQS